MLVVLHQQRITYHSTFYPLGTLNVWTKFKANHPIVEIFRSAPKWWTNQATDLPFCQHGLNEQKTGLVGVVFIFIFILCYSDQKKGNMKLSGCAVGVFESWTQVLFVGSDRRLLWKWSERSIFSFFDEALLWLLQNGNDPRGMLQSFYGSFTTTCSIFIITLIGPRESTDITVQIEEDLNHTMYRIQNILFRMLLWCWLRLHRPHDLRLEQNLGGRGLQESVWESWVIGWKAKQEQHRSSVRWAAERKRK